MQKSSNTNLGILSEDEIKSLILHTLSADFQLVPEVKGKHLIENTPVRIDFMAFPKPHLINNGFDEAWFGIEAKRGNFSEAKQINRLMWQCITYAQSTFEIDSTIIRPMFVLASVDHEPQIGDPKRVEWNTLVNFAPYGNVGVMELQPFWRIRFGGTPYYGQKRGKGKVANVGVNRHIGSWK